MSRPLFAVMLACACAPHELEDERLDAPGVDAAPDSEPPPGVGAAVAPFVPIVEPPCEAAVAHSPSLLLGGLLLWRPPRNVEITDENPTFAHASAPEGFLVTCDARLQRASLLAFRNEPSKSLAVFGREVKELLERNGYVGARELAWEGERDEERRRAVVSIPAIGGEPAVDLLVEIRRMPPVMTLLVFEARPHDFARLEPTLRASADSLLLVPN